MHWIASSSYNGRCSTEDCINHHLVVLLYSKLKHCWLAFFLKFLLHCQVLERPVPTALFVLGQSVEYVFLLCLMVEWTIQTFLLLSLLFVVVVVTLEKRMLDLVISLFDDSLKYIHWNLGIKMNNITIQYIKLSVSVRLYFTWNLIHLFVCLFFPNEIGEIHIHIEYAQKICAVVRLRSYH